uniref:Cation-transporting ATPase n=2 Tax=Lygus hesperus TaxID=30085 RepID=A0A0A9XPD4_LYGHE
MNGDASSHKPYNDVKGHINKGEEEEMEIIGFKESLPHKALTWIGHLVTLGLLRLIFHWWPQLGLYCTHTRCPLEKASKILVVDIYEKRFKSLFVKDIKKISLSEHPGNSSPNGKHVGLENWNEKMMKVHLADGTIRDMREVRLINVKKLTYIWIQENHQFVRLVGLDNGRSKEDLCELPGCTREEQRIRQRIYGRNYIEAPIQSILTLVVLEVLNPFYVFQIFSLAVWFSDKYYYYGVAIIIMSVFGISSSVVQTRRNQKNLHDTINQVDLVTVRRAGGHYDEVETTELVPGDIIVVSQSSIACCDALLLNGSCVVNESMLTGESVPVTKTSVKRLKRKLNVKDDGPNILYCGTQMIQTKKLQGSGDEAKILALVLRTGFLTTKGSLVRSILYPPPADFKFDRDSHKFIWVLALMGLSGTLYSMYYRIAHHRDLHDIFIRSLDLITIAIPVALPASMTVGKIFALGRLKKQKISCINSRVINVSGSTNCICFDKTGTLTEDGMDMWGVLPTAGGSFEAPVHNAKSLPVNSHLLQGMAACHSLTIIDTEITGDPLELKMFEATGWHLEEPDVIDSTNTSEPVVSATVKPPGSRSHDEQIEILHQFQFSSHLQRMSVVVRRTNGEMLMFCKGSPETIISLSQPMTVPEGMMKRLKEYTAQGYRVIAMAWKPVPATSYHHIVKSPREEFERDLRFEGLIMMENKLKVQTKPTIMELQDARMKIVMITGDNMATAICVAKECGILGRTGKAVEIDLNEKGQLAWHDMAISSKAAQIHSGEDVKTFLESSRIRGYEIATTGKAWERIRQTIPALVPKLAENGAIFARMAPDQKQQVIVELQNLGFVVAMCGDGANDCGALKAANVGISLSEAEASVASPFTSQVRDISCVLRVVREGRAALVTAFGICKFMILYSYAEFFSTMFLYNMGSNLADFQFLFIDVFLIINFAFLFGRDKAYKGPIVPQAPQCTLFSVSPIISMIFQAIVISVFQCLPIFILRRLPWFVPFHFTTDDDYTSYENYSIYAISQFQYITLAVVFSQGHPYRERLYKNIPLFTSIIIMTLCCIYLTVYPAQWLITLFEFKFPPNTQYPWTIVGLAAAGFAVSLFFEEFVIHYLLEQKLKFVPRSLLRNKLISGPYKSV